MIQGRIDKIEEIKGETNGNSWTRFVFHLNGSKYSTFDSKIRAGFVEGDLVIIEGFMKGKYFNMTAMRKIPEGTPLENSVEVVKFPLEKKEYHLTEEECRARSIEQALNFVALTGGTKDLETIFKLADKFYTKIKQVNK